MALLSRVGPPGLWQRKDDADSSQSSARPIQEDDRHVAALGRNAIRPDDHIELTVPGLEDGPLPGTVRVRNGNEFRQLVAASNERRAYEQALTESNALRDRWEVVAYCQVCQAPTLLLCDWTSSDGERPNYRERLICPGCRMNSRQRFMATLVGRLSMSIPSPLPLYCYEQRTPFYRWATSYVASHRPVLGSEYLGYDVASGTEVDGVRHEDALALSFADNSLAMMMSADVFEHVPAIDRALSEAHRVLAPGGYLAFSIPFNANSERTIQRAVLQDGKVIEYLPGVYHGNPTTGKGSLVFYDHAWDIFGRCRHAGFSDVYAVAYWSSLYGYLGDGFQLMFVAERM